MGRVTQRNRETDDFGSGDPDGRGGTVGKLPEVCHWLCQCRSLPSFPCRTICGRLPGRVPLSGCKCATGSARAERR